MRRMAGCATFRLNHGMFVHEGAGFVGVALEADGVLGGRRSQLARQKSAVWIMAVIALHQALVDTMMKSSRELLFRLQMAAVTKLWLLLLHQELTFLGIVRR